MKRVCQVCGKTFEGEHYALKCPDCVQAERKTTLRPRTCRSCGATFTGGPRAWYRPTCRAERQREQQRKRRAQGGALRPLGSTDTCVICGKSYVVNSARQKYCPDCAHDAVRAVDREQSKAWNAANMTPEGRREARQSAAADLRAWSVAKRTIQIRVINGGSPALMSVPRSRLSSGVQSTRPHTERNVMHIGANGGRRVTKERATIPVALSFMLIRRPAVP